MISLLDQNNGIKGKELHLRVLEAIEAVKIDPQVYSSRNPDSLSGGEKKRVAIAGVLAMQPEVLVLDEPSAQLDPFRLNLILVPVDI